MAKKILMQIQTAFKKYTSLAQMDIKAWSRLVATTLVVYSFSFLAPEASAKGYHKWIDQDGKTQYTETPPPANAQKVITTAEQEPKQDKKSLRDRVAAESDASKKEDSRNNKPGATPTEKAAEQKKTTAQPTPTPAKISSEASNEAQKKEKSYEELKAEFVKKSCEKAQQNLQSMTDHGRVKMVKDNGEEHFLSAEEKNKKMAETNQFIGTNCKTTTKGKKK